MGLMGRIFGGMARKDSAVSNLLALRIVGRPIWSPRSYSAFAKEAYSQNVIAYRCIRMISENVAAIPFLAYRGKQEIADHPFLNVLARPNPQQSGVELIDMLVAYFKIAGDGFLEAVELDGQIRELYTLRPDRMKAIAGRRGIPSAWRYSVDGMAKADFDMDLPPNRQTPIMHMREFHPLNDWYGLSPIEAAAFSIDVHNSAGGYNKALLDNAASPSGALVYEGEEEGDDGLSQEQFDRLKAQMEERHQGPKNAGRPMLLEGGLKWVPMGLSPKDLEFTSGKREAAREIALGFGVPPMLLGIPGDNTYSNYQEARLAFFEETIIPLMGKICNSISNWVQPTYPDLRLGYDEDQIPALALRREAAWKRAQDSDFITTDEKREAVGYGPYQPTGEPGGSIITSAAQMPLEEAGFQPGGPEPDGDE